MSEQKWKCSLCEKPLGGETSVPSYSMLFMSHHITNETDFHYIGYWCIACWKKVQFVTVENSKRVTVQTIEMKEKK